MDIRDLIPQLRSRSFVHQTETGSYLTDAGRGIHFKLTAPAAIVIDMCDGAMNLRSIVVEAASKFHISERQLEPKLVSLFERLQQMGLVSLLSRKERFRLRSVVLELTGACNLRCCHCVYADRSDGKLMLDFEIINKTIFEMARMGVEEVFLSGGEPTLHPSIIDIIRTIKRNGIQRVVLLSNGQLIDEPFAKRLRRAGIDQVRISVDGTTPLINDRIRGKDSFSGAMRALSVLRHAGVNTGIVYTACKLNRADWAGLLDFAEDIADAIYAGEIVKWGRAKAHEAKLALTPAEVAEFRLLLSDARFAYSSKRSDFLVNPEGTDFAYRRGMCVAGREKATITWRGTVIPCSFFDQPEMQAGELYKNGIESVWTTSPVFDRLRSLSVCRFSRCSECNYRFICGGGCRAKSYALHGVLEGPPCPSDCLWREHYFQQIVEKYGSGAREFIEGSGKYLEEVKVDVSH